MPTETSDRKQLVSRPMSHPRRSSEQAATATPSTRSPARRLAILLARIGLGAVTVILSVNLWTGFPIFALWVGSHATGGQLLSMTGVAAAVIALGIMLTLGVWILSRVSETYDRLTGRPPPVRQPPPWLLSMSAAKAQPAHGRREINAIEAIVVATVVSALIAFEIWFFVLSSSKLTG